MQLSFELDAAPEGLVYLPDFVSADEERALVEVLGKLDYHAVVMHGQAAKRTVAHFGVTYGYESWSLDNAPPLPAWVQPLVPRVAAAMKEPPAALGELLVSRYPPGARIGWHRDAPMFGPTVAALSLGAACTLKLRNKRRSGYDQYSLDVAPRSLYVLGGAARAVWQHMVPPTKEQRYSLTFRTLKPGARPTRIELRRQGDVRG
jgi:alkylated DNA repair dioxygenase AlkB